MTEKGLLHKRERKRRRRVRRKKELTPEQIELKELTHYAKMLEGEIRLRRLYARAAN